MTELHASTGAQRWRRKSLLCHGSRRCLAHALGRVGGTSGLCQAIVEPASSPHAWSGHSHLIQAPANCVAYWSMETFAKHRALGICSNYRNHDRRYPTCNGYRQDAYGQTFRNRCQLSILKKATAGADTRRSSMNGDDHTFRSRIEKWPKRRHPRERRRGHGNDVSSPSVLK